MKAYVFPGQGSQYRGMGKGLFEKYKDMIQLADEILGYSVEELCLLDPNRQLGMTQYTQPALYIVNALYYKQALDNDGYLPDYLAGHSLGEYNALQASGAMSFEDGLKLVKKRGELMSKAPKGAMAAILGSTEDEITHLLIRNDLSTVDIANCNSPDQTVISGLEEDIAKTHALFNTNNIKFIPLNTSGAFHSRYMKSAASEFGKYVDKFIFSPLTIDVISNVYAKPYAQDQISEHLTSQIMSSVKWLESVHYMIDRGVTHFREIGVGNILTTLIEKIQAHSNQHRTETAASRSTPLDKHITEKIDRKEENTLDIVDSNLSEIEITSNAVETWNKTYPIGTKVYAKNHNDVLETRTQAVLLFGRKSVIYMNGYKGYFDLVEVEPAGNQKVTSTALDISRNSLNVHLCT